jgi:N-acetylneuraminate synthase
MVYVVAEIGINHNGDIDLAKELIYVAAKAGCNAVKFQKRTIDLVYSKEELDKSRESPWGTTNREQKEGLEFSIEQHVGLERYADRWGLDYIVSCWDLNSLVEVERHLHCFRHKVASAMLTNGAFLDALNATNKGIILSTGMSTSAEVDWAVGRLKRIDYILACTSTYPSVEEEVNLGYITTLREVYPHIRPGFSNHYSGGLACYGAVALGVEMVEFHITKDRTMYGSDQAASIQHVDIVVRGIRKMEAMCGDGHKRVYDSEILIKQKLRK